MANRFKGEVAVDLGEGDTKRTVIFRLGINELIALQKEWGLESDDEAFIVALDNRNKSFKRNRSLVRAAMLHEQSDTTEEQAGDIISELGLKRTNEVIDDTLWWALPDKSQASQGAPKKDAVASPGTLPS